MTYLKIEGEWGPAFISQNIMIDKHADKYNLQDQNWRKQNSWNEPTKETRKKMGKVRQNLIAISVVLAVSLPLASLQAAPVFDGYFQGEQKKNAKAWAAEDKNINEKLAKLEKRFGKKPNIIYILSDDVGWGELGWQGGGKHRGTPTPTLDTMAKEGMAFWSAYAEPSCTPTRIAINTGRHPVRTGLLSVL